MTAAYLPLVADAVVLVHHYHDGSALLGALGPFTTEAEALAAVTQLGDLAGHDAWTAVPMRTVQPMSIGPLTRLAAYVPIAPELVTEPTDADRARWAARQAEEDARAVALRTRYAAVLAEVRDQLLYDVLALHAPTEQHGRWLCCGCAWDGVDYEVDDWPCRTAQLALNPTTDTTTQERS